MTVPQRYGKMLHGDPGSLRETITQRCSPLLIKANDSSSGSSATLLS